FSFRVPPDSHFPLPACGERVGRGVRRPAWRPPVGPGLGTMTGMKASRGRWVGVGAVLLASAAGCTPRTTVVRHAPPPPNCGFTPEVPCSPPAAQPAAPAPAIAPAPAVAGQAPFPPATEAPPAGPQWPPAGTAAPASSAPLPRPVDVGSVLPTAACRELGQV